MYKVGNEQSRLEMYMVSVSRCVMEEDPIAQNHLAKFRGEYDEWGNRLTRTMINTRHLLEVPGETKQRKTRGRRKKMKEEKETTEQVHCLLEDNFSKALNNIIFSIFIL